MSRQASWMARRFRVEHQEAYQLLALAICQGMNRRHARLRTLRTLVRDSRKCGQQVQVYEPSTTDQRLELIDLAREILDQVEWQLLDLHLLQQISLRDAAKQVGIGRETARGLYHSALAKIREYMETQR